MRIVYFHQHFSTPEGAAGTRSYEMARRLVAAGHQVTIVCGSYRNGSTGLQGAFAGGKRTGNVDGIDIVEYDLSYSNKDGFLKRSWAFAKFALRSSALAIFTPSDVVFASSTPLTAAVPGICAKWLRGRTFVFEVRDLWPELPQAMGVVKNKPVLWLLSILERVAYASADRLVALSPGILEGIARHNISRQRIFLIPNGCDTDYFSDNVELWRPAGIHTNDFLAVFSGTHGQANGLDAVLEAAKVLRQRSCNKIKILLIGDGMEKARLKAKALEYRITDIVHFHEPVPKAKLVGLLAAADTGLQILANTPAFYFGTSPNKFFDYLAAGLPVVTNYPGWVANILKEGECGLAVPPDEPEALADALVYMSELPGTQRNEMGARASRIAMETFSREKLAAEFVRVVCA